MAEQSKPMADTDTYQRPAHGWTCFHCGETFSTEGSARVHFGAAPDAEPGCLARVQYGAERGLLMKLRDAEEQIAKYVAEDTALVRSMYAAQTRHVAALRTAEELGYERGLHARDADFAELVEALQIAVRQNSHDMLMTGDELRVCEAAIAKATGEAP